MEDIIKCLEAILLDQEATILRIKNRLTHSYNADVTAGYRNVAINIAIATPQTRRLGIDGHVCELQLILRPFHILKTESGHQRYVAFRNKRAE